MKLLAEMVNLTHVCVFDHASPFRRQK